MLAILITDKAFSYVQHDIDIKRMADSAAKGAVSGSNAAEEDEQEQ